MTNESVFQATSYRKYWLHLLLGWFLGCYTRLLLEHLTAELGGQPGRKRAIACLLETEGTDRTFEVKDSEFLFTTFGFLAG